MDRKTKKTVLITTIIFFVITITFMAYKINNIKELEDRSGTYFYKINILKEDSKRLSKWDVGISKNDIKTSINESDSNREALDKFRIIVDGISRKKTSLFLLSLYLTFIIVILVIIHKDKQIYKSKKQKIVFLVFITLLMIFLIYKIFTSSIGLNGLYKDASYYFKLIS